MTPFEEIAAAMANPRNKVLYAFMHRAIPTYGLKHEGVVRFILDTDNNKDARISEMIKHAWRRCEELEAQPTGDFGSLRHEIHNLADVPGKAILVWPPETPKVAPLSPLGVLAYPEGGPARYFVLENSVDLETREAQPPVLGEWSFLEGNPNPLHGNFGHFGEAGKEPSKKDLVDRVSMMVAHPGKRLDKTVIQTTTSADGKEVQYKMAGANLKIRRPENEEEAREVLGNLIEDLKKLSESQEEKNDENP